MMGLMERLEKLCQLPGVSGNEDAVRNAIKDELAGKVEDMRVDAMGNLIARKKGKKKGLASVKVVLAAHTDEVGLRVRSVRDDGLLSFAAPGIDPRVLCSKRVKVGAKGVPGVIGAKAIHLQSREEFERALKVENLFIDVGASDKTVASKLAAPGDYAVFESPFVRFGDSLVKSKALDDRVGCALIIDMLISDIEFEGVELWGAFTTQEEIGCRGARAASYSIAPDAAIILEGTTAGDTPPAKPTEYVCSVGDGPVVSFMDRASIATPAVFSALTKAAERTGVKWQVKRGATGGNDSGAFQHSFAPVMTGVISIPCRYIHSPANVMSTADFEGARALLAAFLSAEARELSNKGA